ncbi:uncharacterized protein LOC128278237 [Anopheles cruzii]|uniref:uncharacterized protein LOC128278237 n=1 Tax=Anopheles cruzii TaxID=68878 RepID=UPI0022EC932F|nr:uncharacterized protein LOC128278237 [Anopheles cruzii]
MEPTTMLLSPVRDLAATDEADGGGSQQLQQKPPTLRGHPQSPPPAPMATSLVASQQEPLVPSSPPPVDASACQGLSLHLPATTSTAIQLATTATPIERLSRPMAFDKMESLVRETQDQDTGVPVRSQKLFLTSIPSAFMGYDLIEWLMERLSIEESEALNISNQLCQHGYFFPVSDSKTLLVKDDSSLYRFQTPYYWPWQQKAPDQIEYAIYLAKRSLRNKQRHGLEDYETDALASLHKNLKGKWDFIMMQAEEQVRLAKERKKGDKIVGDSQERAYWRVHRPPPGQFTPLEPCPIPSRDRQGKPRRRTVDDWQRELDILRASLGRNRVKMSQACESLVAYYETFAEYDPMMQPPLPSNPWVTEDVSFWQLNGPVVEVPTEKRVKRWGISIEEIVSDPTGLQEFTHYLKKEYSHENIRFWMAVNDLRRSAHSQIPRKVREIYEMFLEPGAPCEINIDGKTMERVQQGLRSPSRFAFDSAAEHIYMLLLKKDCYPRFVRSEHYKTLLANAIQPSHKKRFFGFGGGAKKKGSTSTAPNASTLLTQPSSGPSGTVNSLSKRRGSDRSLSGSAHELAISGVKDCTKVPHSHSQSNLSEIPYREVSKPLGTMLEATVESGGVDASVVCPWDLPGAPAAKQPAAAAVATSVCPWDDAETDGPVLPAASQAEPTTTTTSTSASQVPATATHATTEISEMSERMKRSCGLRQNTLDSDFHSTKRLTPVVTEQRRASMTTAPRLSDLQFCLRANSAGEGTAATPDLGTLPQQSSSAAPARRRQPYLTHQTSVSQDSPRAMSFEEREDTTITSATMLDAYAGPRTPECPQQPDENPRTQSAAGSGQETRITGNVGGTVSRVITKTTTIATANTATTTTTNPTTGSTTSSHATSQKGATEATGHITIHNTTTTTTTSNTVRSGPVHDTTGTPRISVIYVRSSLDDDGECEGADTPVADTVLEAPAVDEEEEEVEEVCAAVAAVATQTTEAAVCPPCMSPLNEPLDHFFPEVLVAHRGRGTSAGDGDYDLLLLDGRGELPGLVTGLVPGCVAPAPTPTPLIAPLAEVELDDQPEDDDDDDAADEDVLDDRDVKRSTPEEEEDDPDRRSVVEPAKTMKTQQHPTPACHSTATVVIIDNSGRRRKRKERMVDHTQRTPDDHDTIQQQRSEDGEGTPGDRKGTNSVCPWDDEDEAAVDEAPYVKTYSTLGYL